MSRYENVFRWSAVCLLGLTAAAKLLSATGHAAILDLPDPLLGLANRRLLLVVGAVELAVVGCLLSPWNLRLKYLSLGWLSCNFLVYRIAFHLISPEKPCPCLGTITDKLPLSPRGVAWLLWSVVFYLLVGSLFWLGWLGRRLRPVAARLQ